MLNKETIFSSHFFRGCFDSGCCQTVELFHVSYLCGVNSNTALSLHHDESQMCVQSNFKTNLQQLLTEWLKHLWINFTAFTTTCAELWWRNVCSSQATTWTTKESVTARSKTSLFSLALRMCLELTGTYLMRTTYFHLVSILKKGGVIPPLPHMPFCLSLRRNI